MELEEIYKQWRWALYNEVDISFIELCIEKPSILKNPYDEVGLSKKYSVEILESYKCKKFDVNKDQMNCTTDICSKNLTNLPYVVQNIFTQFLEDQFLLRIVMLI